MSINIYKNLWSSLVASCQERITELKALGISEDLQYYDFDSFAGVAALPEKDLLGLSGFSLQIDNKKLYIAVMINISTRNDDEYLTRHRAIINYMLDALIPTTQIPYIDADTGDRIATLQVAEGTGALPITGVFNRSVQSIDVDLLTTIKL